MQDGLEALFVFQERAGDRVLDVAGVLDLTIKDPTAVDWMTRGLRIARPTTLTPIGSSKRLIDRLRATNALTVEAWLRCTEDIAPNVDRGRIVAISGGPGTRNFMLAQFGGRKLVARLRTTGTDLAGVVRLQDDKHVSPESSNVSGLAHVVFTRDVAGRVRLYVDGRDPVTTRPAVDGQFTNWDKNFKLYLGNESTGDRAWLGEYFLIAIYSRALSDTEVAKNFAAGA